MQTDAEAQSGGVIQSLVTGIKNRKKRIRRSRGKLEDANDADDDIEGAVKRMLMLTINISC